MKAYAADRIAAVGRQKMLICPFIVTSVLIFWPLNFKNFATLIITFKDFFEF